MIPWVPRVYGKEVHSRNEKKNLKSTIHNLDNLDGQVSPVDLERRAVQGLPTAGALPPAAFTEAANS